MKCPLSIGALQTTNAQLDTEAADLRQQAAVLREGHRCAASARRVPAGGVYVDVVLCFWAQQRA